MSFLTFTDFFIALMAKILRIQDRSTNKSVFIYICNILLSIYCLYSTVFKSRKQPALAQLGSRNDHKTQNNSKHYFIFGRLKKVTFKTCFPYFVYKTIQLIVTTALCTCSRNL